MYANRTDTCDPGTKSAASETKTENPACGIPRVHRRRFPYKGAPARTLTPGTRAPVQGTLPGRIPRCIGIHAFPLEPPRHDMAPRLPF